MQPLGVLQLSLTRAYNAACRFLVGSSIELPAPRNIAAHLGLNITAVLEALLVDILEHKA